MRKRGLAFAFWLLLVGLTFSTLPRASGQGTEEEEEDGSDLLDSNAAEPQAEEEDHALGIYPTDASSSSPASYGDKCGAGEYYLRFQALNAIINDPVGRCTALIHISTNARTSCWPCPACSRRRPCRFHSLTHAVCNTVEL